MEGEWIKLMIYPEGNARSLRNLLPQEPEPELHNKFYYRIPEICEVVVNYAGTTLASRRISIFQSGALVSEKVPME